MIIHSIMKQKNQIKNKYKALCSINIPLEQKIAPRELNFALKMRCFLYKKYAVCINLFFIRKKASFTIEK